jgi:hypothetical protein
MPTHGFFQRETSRLEHAPLSTDLVHGRTVLRLPQGDGNRLVREAFARLGIHPPSGFRMPEKSALGADRLAGSGSPCAVDHAQSFAPNPHVPLNVRIGRVVFDEMPPILSGMFSIAHAYR